jgi:ribosome-binding protein aMBF1 (putative translation factor)
MNTCNYCGEEGGGYYRCERCGRLICGHCAKVNKSGPHILTVCEDCDLKMDGVRTWVKTEKGETNEIPTNE